MTDAKNFVVNSGGCIDGLLYSNPKSNIECVFIESCYDSLLSFLVFF